MNDERRTNVGRTSFTEEKKEKLPDVSLSTPLSSLPSKERKEDIPGGSAPPKLTPVQRIVEGWKVLNGVKRDDKAWDRQFYPQCLKHAKCLLELFDHDADAALDCMETVWEELVGRKGLTLSMAGVVKNSTIPRQKWLERKAKRGI